MHKLACRNAGIEEKDTNAKKILKGSSISISAANQMFYRQIVAHQGFTFEPRIPKKETLQSTEDARVGNGKKYDGLADLFEK